MCTLLKRKTFPAFPELGSNPKRDWFIDISYAASLWQKLWWKRIPKNLILQKIAQIPGKADGNKEEGECLASDSSRNSCKSVGGSWTRAQAPQT